MFDLGESNYQNTLTHYTSLHYRDHILNTSEEIMICHNKLVCYITLGWKGLLGTNTLAYRAHS